MTRKKSAKHGLFGALVVLIIVTTSVGFADDFAAPPWRNSDGTTWQEWTFSTSQKGPLNPDYFFNDIGMAQLWVDTSYGWIDTSGQRQGIWPLGELDIFIPNYLDNSPGTMKEIAIQLTWKSAGNNWIPDQPGVLIVPDYSGDPSGYVADISREDVEIVNGWVHTIFTINVRPNPSEEWIAIKGDILVDQVVIDTYCIPEPATIMLFGIGGILMLVRRKNTHKG